MKTIKLPVVPESMPTHDNTMFSWWNACPRLYDFSANQGLRKKTEKKAKALSWGGLMHDGLAEWYRTFDAEKALRVIDEHPDWQEEEDVLESSDALIIEKEQDFRTKARALQKLKEYIEYYGQDSKWKVLLTETPFELIEDDGFRYGGKIDLVVRWNGMPWVVDHKTTTRFGSTMSQRDNFYRQFINSPQMAGYTWAGSKLHGEPVVGVIINVVCIHKIPKAPEIQMDRRAIPFDEGKIEEWRQMRIAEYAEIERAKQLNLWRPRWDSCITKYGPCAYFDVCRVPIESRQRYLDLDFEHHPWTWKDEEE